MTDIGDFLEQGPILRMMLMVCFLGMLWLGLITLVARREAERSRRRKEGLPPLPNVFTQLWNAGKNYLQQPSEEANRSAETTTPRQANSPPGDLPLPDLNMLTSDLPEPDFDRLSNPQPPEPLPEEFIDEEEVAMADDAQPTPPQESPRAAAAQSSTPTTQADMPPDTVEVMRVYRDLSDGSLIVEMNGERFQTVAEMRDRGLVKRFINIVRDMVQLAKVGAQAAGLKPPSFEANAGVVSEPGAWNKQRNAAAQSPAPTAEPPPTLTADPMASITSRPPGGEEPVGIVAQIEEYLQYRLMQTPVFQHRDIHVRAAGDGSLRIQVDDRSYEAVDQIVDVDVREFIQTVIREWEARQ